VGCIRLGGCAGECCTAGRAVVASLRALFGVEVLARVVTPGRTGEDGPREVLFPKFVIHPRWTPPRKCWVVEFEEMK
jgi:hypothetical protein